MPRPLPSYVPDAVREKIAKENWTGLKGVAKASGLSYTTVVSFYKDSRHEDYRTIKRFCDGVGISISKAMAIMSAGPNLRRIIFDWYIRRRYQTYDECGSSCGVSLRYIYDLISGIAAKSLKDTYIPMASGLALDLDELSAVIGDEI